MKLKSVKDVNLKQKRVLFRVDYDTPTKGSGKNKIVTDDTRIKLTLPTLEYLLKQNAKVIILAKHGRPDGKVVESLRLDPMAKHLRKLIKHKVTKLNETIGPQVESFISKMKSQEIVMLENTRFLPGETKNDPSTAKAIAALGDIIVNDAFSLSHRAHASVSGIAKFLPMVAGFHLTTEVKMLSRLIKKPKRPFVAIVGGAKVSDKVGAVLNLAKIADTILVGGGVSNNFLKAEGVNVLSSYLQGTVADEKKRGVNYVDFAKELLKRYQKEKILLHSYIPVPKIVYPVDVIAANKIKNPSTIKTVNLVNCSQNGDLNDKLMFLDIGPATIKFYQEIIAEAETIFWNGPMGVFEENKFATGTREIARAVAKSKGVTILGGGDTIAAIKKFHLAKRYDYISAAGGASLEFLAGKKLPGIEPMRLA